jgi:hypothetical protein
MRNSDNKGGGFWSQVGSALEKLAILYLVICLINWFMQWSFQSKIKCWVFWSVLCTVGSFAFLGIGIAFVGVLTGSHFYTHPWYLTRYFLASAISGMVWAAILVETKLREDFPKDRSSLAGCCIVSIALLIPSTILLGKWSEKADAEQLKQGYTLPAEPTAPPPHGCLRLWFARPITDDLLSVDNYALIAHLAEGKTAPVRIFKVSRFSDSAIELDTAYIPRFGEHVEVELSSNLVSRAGMAQAELR